MFFLLIKMKKRKGKDPAVLWYWGDWNSGTTTFSRHLKGCYMDLLHAQFNSGHLSIEEIRTVLGTDFGSWPTLQKKFAVDEAGKYFNERLEQEKQLRQAYTKSRKENLEGKNIKYANNPHMEPHMVPHMEDEDESKIENVIEIDKYKKYGNLFFGEVPADLMALIERLDKNGNALEWHRYVEAEIKKIGYETEREVPCLLENMDGGRIDLVVYKDGKSIAIELDNRTPRTKSIEKVKTYQIGMVLLRDARIMSLDMVTRWRKAAEADHQFILACCKNAGIKETEFLTATEDFFLTKIATGEWSTWRRASDMRRNCIYWMSSYGERKRIKNGKQNQNGRLRPTGTEPAPRDKEFGVL